MRQLCQAIAASELPALQGLVRITPGIHKENVCFFNVFWSDSNKTCVSEVFSNVFGRFLVFPFGRFCIDLCASNLPKTQISTTKMRAINPFLFWSTGSPKKIRPSKPGFASGDF